MYQIYKNDLHKKNSVNIMIKVRYYFLSNNEICNNKMYK